MPKTAALAVAASRGFGEFTSGLTLTTVTFTSSTTWVAPSYVSSLVQMVGYGTNATSDDYSTDTSSLTTYRCTKAAGSGGSATTHDWSELYNNLQAWITFINTGTPGTRSGGPMPDSSNIFYSIYSDNTYQNFSTPRTPGYGSFSSVYFQVGTGTNSSNFSVPTSGTITYANTPTNPLNQVSVQFRVVYLGSNGTAATGVGNTFPGGTYDFATGIGGAAPTTTFNNVTVTPSSSYSIVVPSGGQISISYYAPA